MAAVTASRLHSASGPTDRTEGPMEPTFKAEDHEDVSSSVAFTPELPIERPLEVVPPAAEPAKPVHPGSGGGDDGNRGTAGMALRLGFVALVITGAVVLV